MKKYLSIILALALVLSLSVPVFAANESSAQTDLSFTAELAAPSYTVTIPSSLNLNLGDTYLPIEISEVENIDNKAVVVTFEGTQQSAGVNQFITLLEPPKGVLSGIYYGIYDINNLRIGGGSNVISAGLYLVAMNGEGEANIRINIPTDTPDIVPGATYQGHIVFGIKLVEL